MVFNTRNGFFSTGFDIVYFVYFCPETRLKLGPANENDKQQLAFLCNACKGIPQVYHMLCSLILL